MKSITIQGKKRESVGKTSTRALRNADQVPCVVYGDKQVIHFSTDQKSFKDLVYTPESHTVQLVLDSGEKIEAILQDIQFHPVSDKILHVDFYQLFKDKPVTIEIPVKLTGRAKGIVSGGVLMNPIKKIKIKSLPTNLPDAIQIDITPLKIGQKVYVKEMRNDRYAILHPDNAVVVAIKTSRVAVKDASSDEDTTDEKVTITDIIAS